VRKPFYNEQILRLLARIQEACSPGAEELG
jgi:hypothetical protein